MEIKIVDKIEKPDLDLIFGLFDKKDLEKHPFFGLLDKEEKAYARFVLEKGRPFEEVPYKIGHLHSANLHLIFVSLGDSKKWRPRYADLAVRKAVFALKEIHSKGGLLNLGDFFSSPLTAEESLRRIVESLLMANFSFEEYKSPAKSPIPKIEMIKILVPSVNKKFAEALKGGIIIGKEVNHCRAQVNTPGTDLTPSFLAKETQKEFQKFGNKVKVKVLGIAEMKKLRMGGILGVSQGSKEKPAFIILEYQDGPKSKKPLVLIGKGVTYDTGGINLKPENAILGMHMDMSGGAGVIHGLAAIAQLKLKTNVIGLVPATENMPSGSSYKPGDILKTISGKTIEVLNTDAEGRIILADTIGYALKYYKPALIVDLATLTGAAIVALGQRVSALMTQDQKLEEMAREIGEKSGDEVWPLPLWDDYAEEIKGTFGDVANISKTRWGGAIIGGIFLRQFVGDCPWFHLDIAPMMETIEGQYLAKGASGVGVRFIVELARRFES